MRANKNYLLVEPDDTLKKNHGIVLADMGTVDQAPISGVVIYAGDMCEQVRAGDKVLFEMGTGLKQNIDGKNLLLMNEDVVLAIIN